MIASVQSLPTAVSLINQCHNCKKTPEVGPASETDAKIMRCGGCKAVSYCGTACQNADWKNHKTFCQLWKPVATLASDWKSLDEKAGNIMMRAHPGVQKVRDVWTVFNKAGNGSHIPQLLSEFFMDFAPQAALPVELMSLFSGMSLEQPSAAIGKQNKTAVDLGCGIGTSSLWLLVAGYQVTAIDVCEAALNQLRKDGEGWITDGKLHTELTSVEAANFREADLVVANDILPYTNPASLAQLLRKIFDSMNKGGNFFGSLFIENQSRKGPQTDAALKQMGAWMLRDGKQVPSLLQSIGFEAVKICPRTGRDDSTVEFHVRKPA